MTKALPITDTPIEGYYRMRLRRGAVFVGIRIWYGPPHDPDTGEEMDRSWRWQALMNGTPIDLDRVWPQCANESVSEAEYKHLSRLQQWSIERAPESGFADPHRRIDPLSTQNPLPF